MRIQGEIWSDSKTHLTLKLKEPYWSAWKRFNWKTAEEGYSVSTDAIKKATELKVKIMVKTKYGEFEITPTKALKRGGYMQTYNGKELICIPRSAFTKIPNMI